MGPGAGGREIARRLILRQLAEKDLAGIFRYSIENWGMARAVVYRDLLFGVIRSLTERPARGSSFRHAPGLRSIKAGQHRVYYSFDDEEVRIVRVLHHAMMHPAIYTDLA